MGLLFGKVNVDDKDLEAIGVMVEESCGAVKSISSSVESVSRAVESVAKVVRDKKVSAFWGLIKIE